MFVSMIELDYALYMIYKVKTLLEKYTCSIKK